jgi:hypothetical protein
MANRAGIIGATGANHPDNWSGGLASDDLHAVIILFARDDQERERCRVEHEKYLAQIDGVEVLSSLDLGAIPSKRSGAHEHFGYRDRLSTPVVEGMGEEPTPGSGHALKAGEFFLGYPDEEGDPPALPRPEILSFNGSYVAYMRIEEHVGAFRDFLRQKYQGVSPPVARSEQDFDPGAKYHIPGNTPYTRYFLSFILQFQFHKALCDAAGFKGPLNECSIAGSKEAGRRYAEMLKLGASQPWPDTLEKLTGTRRMDASAIIEYFKPLEGWLDEQNQGRQCGWN